MSYVRWSTVINPSISSEEELNLFENGINFKEVQDLKLKNNDSFLSNWYIYWHSDGVMPESNEKEKQLLAIWYKGSKYPVFSYSEVINMYENDNWLSLGDFDQKEVMIDCVEKWLKDINEL